MKNTVEMNKQLWNDDHHWSQEGDEWDGQARKCGVPYVDWKASLIETLITPNATDSVTVEIAPGFGRWSTHIAPIARELHLVDISPKCIEICKDRLNEFSNVSYYVTEGDSIPIAHDNSVDFVFSFDSFVHMDQEIIGIYFNEFKRLLKNGGVAIIHHANRRALYLSFLRRLGWKASRLYQMISMGNMADDDGWRSNVSADLVVRLARKAGLRVDQQLIYWNNGHGVPRYNDRITIIKA